MKALLLTVGSQGDVQPFLALALRLQAGGHEAVLVAPAAFSGLASAYNVPFVPLELDMSEVGGAVAGHYGLRHMVKFCQAMGRQAAAALPGLQAAAAGGADVVVHHPVLPLGQHLAELLGVPAVVAQPMPAPVTVLHAFSAHVVPRPADWPATAHVTGYWPLPAAPGWSPPRRLAEFLEADGPVVYVGFGSMPGLDPARLAVSVMTAAGKVGVRAVVASLDPALRRLLPSGRFLVIRNAPHDWLFPRVQAVVHHGGAGTTGAAISAGRPQVIWPFGVDQPFWSRRMTHLGVAPPALPVRALTGRTLTAVLDRALSDPRTAQRAAALGSVVRAEDGTGRAVSCLEEVLAGRRLAVGA